MYLIYMGVKNHPLKSGSFTIGRPKLTKEYTFDLITKEDPYPKPTQVVPKDGEYLLKECPHSFRLANAFELPKEEAEEKEYLCPVVIDGEACGKTYKAGSKQYFIAHLQKHIDNDELDEMPDVE